MNSWNAFISSVFLSAGSVNHEAKVMHAKLVVLCISCSSVSRCFLPGYLARSSFGNSSFSPIIVRSIPDISIPTDASGNRPKKSTISAYIGLRGINGTPSADFCHLPVLNFSSHLGIWYLSIGTYAFAPAMHASTYA